MKVGGPLSASNGEIVHQWAIDGHGIILRSVWDVGPSLERGDLVRVLPDYSQRVNVGRCIRRGCRRRVGCGYVWNFWKSGWRGNMRKTSTLADHRRRQEPTFVIRYA